RRTPRTSCVRRPSGRRSPTPPSLRRGRSDRHRQPAARPRGRCLMARTKKDRPGESGPVPHQETTPHTQEEPMTGTPTITIPGRRLYDMLNMVLPHAEPLEEALDADLVCIEVRDTSLYVVATDRYTPRVARHGLDAPAPRRPPTLP